MSDDASSSKMPLLAHLVELRGRLLKSVIAIIVLFFVFFSDLKKKPIVRDLEKKK